MIPTVSELRAQSIPKGVLPSKWGVMTLVYFTPAEELVCSGCANDLDYSRGAARVTRVEFLDGAGRVCDFCTREIVP